MAEIEGWKYIALESVGSTNDEAKKYCHKPQQKTVVKADIQTNGRGRRGRTWISDYGNLFFSLAFEFDLKDIGFLVLISSLSLAQTVESFAPKITPKLKLTNDVLLNGAKLSGILLEKSEKNYIIAGIGVNIISAPKNKNLLYKTTSLRENGIICSAKEFLGIYLQKFNCNLSLLKNNKRTMLRAEWLKRVYGINQPIIVHSENKIETGIFSGVDENMALLLKQNDKTKKILAGDVFLKTEIKIERV